MIICALVAAVLVGAAIAMVYCTTAENRYWRDVWASPPRRR